MPRANSARIAIVVLAVLLTLGWATVNMRFVPAGSQAVMLRFGRVAGVRQSGFVMALPPPFEEIVLLPAAPQSAVLTGGSSPVSLNAAIEWRIADAASYCVARARVAEALQHVFLSAAVAIAASGPLNADPQARPGLREALVAAMNARLAALTRAGAGLGVVVTRADVAGTPPPSDVAANPRTGPDLAAARMDATRTRQQAEQTRDARLSEAHANAAERVAAARASIATIAALSARMDPAARSNALDELYRERIGPILRQAGSISAVDAKSVSRLILPGAQ